MWAAVSNRQTVIIPGRRPRKNTSPSDDQPVSLTTSINAVFAEAFGFTVASRVIQINKAAIFKKTTMKAVKRGTILMSSVFNMNATIKTAMTRRKICHEVGSYVSETSWPKLAKKSAAKTAVPAEAKIRPNVVTAPLK